MLSRSYWYIGLPLFKVMSAWPPLEKIILGTFPKATSQGYFPQCQHPKCAISKAATYQDCPGQSARPLACFSLGALSPLPPLGSCRLGNCTFGKLSFGKQSLGEVALGNIPLVKNKTTLKQYGQKTYYQDFQIELYKQTIISFISSV